MRNAREEPGLLRGVGTRRDHGRRVGLLRLLLDELAERRDVLGGRPDVGGGLLRWGLSPGLLRRLGR